jgi:guanine deaminase
MTVTRDIRRIFKGLVMNPVSIDRVDFYHPGYVVTYQGRIDRLTPHDPRPDFPDAEFTDFGNNAILPGFVDTHVHLPQFAIMGIGAGSLLEWLNGYALPEESRFSDSEYARVISNLFFDRLISSGTTCASIYCSVHETATDIAFDVAAQKGIRAFIGKSMMDQNAPAGMLEIADQSLNESTRLFEKWDGANDGRLRYVFTPRFAGSCSMDLMRRVGQIAHERAAFIQSHLSENESEVAWIRSIFPGQASYTDVYATAGLLGRRTIMAHCIHVSDSEIALLANNGTGIAFCPYSNRVLRSGVMPYERLRQAGLRIGLGSDVGGGPTLSMFRQMGEALSSANIGAPRLTPQGALYLATLGGAKVLGLEDRIGSFAPGKDADFIVVDHQKIDPLHGSGSYEAHAQILSRLCYNGAAGCIKETYVLGQKLHQVP